MKNWKHFIIIIAPVLFYSCEENFNPFGESGEQYVLNCILRGDTTLQLATVARTYNTGGFNPFDNVQDPYLSGAEVRVWYKDSVFLLKDTSIVRNDTSRYKSPINIYTSSRFSIGFNEPLEIEVLLPNGRRLKSSTRSAGRTTYQSTSSTTIPGSSANFITIEWTSSSPGIYYFPEFSIVYYKKEGSQLTRYIKKVPSHYESGTPVYFKPMQQASIRISAETLLTALNEISEGDDEKSNYTIDLRPIIKIAAFDEALSRYYSTTSKSADPLTVTVDENDYSNIDGGFGIFASFTSARYTNIKFFSSFITPLGYNVLELD